MKIQKTLGAGVLSLGLVVGLASFVGATSGTIGTTGPDSYNKVDESTYHKVKVVNNNDIRVKNDNNQHASTGDAKAYHNTRAGDARTGSASNANSLNATVAVDNTSSSADIGGGGATTNSTGTINNTGPDSYNKVEISNVSRTEVQNNNGIEICNDNWQSAKSGDATVADNTTGGSATTGNASNTNTASMTIRVSN